MPDHNIEVIDLGLTVPQAIDARAGDRAVSPARTHCPPAWNSIDAAREWFTGEAFDAGNGRQDATTTATRCELNAFSSDELAEFIEDGLARHGVTAKLVPPPDVLAEHVRTVRDEALTEMVWAEIADMVDIDAVVRRSDRRPSGPGRGGRGAHPRHLHRRPDPVMAVVGATARERAHRGRGRPHRRCSAHNSQSNWPRRRTTRSSTFTGWPRSSTTSTTTVTLFVEVPSASHSVAAHADTAGLDAQG